MAKDNLIEGPARNYDPSPPYDAPGIKPSNHAYVKRKDITDRMTAVNKVFGSGYSPTGDAMRKSQLKELNSLPKKKK